jgi:hypothetical protein
MSKIMRQLYAEARAAREAAQRAREVEATPRRANQFWTPERTSGIEWWKTVYERVGRGLKDAQAEVANTAIRSIRRPSAPEEHAEWWRKQLGR